MPDIFDDIAGNTGSASAAPTGDVFDAIAGNTPGAAPVVNSEGRGILNQTLRGAGSALGLVDEFLPQESNDPNNFFGIRAPHLFGLFSRPEGTESFPEVFDRLGRQTGIITNDAPQTQLGKLAGNVGENATSAMLFGPAAMAASGAFGGVGGYVGEAAFGPTGRAVGSMVGNLSPAGISKLGILRELGEQLGPTVSQFPILRSIFGDAPVEAAVGRAISKSAEDLPATEAALQTVANTVGPLNKLDDLKTTAEVVGDKGLMRAEDAVQNMLPNAPFKTIAEERAGIRAADTFEGYDPKATAYDVSKGIEQQLGTAAEKVREVESKAWAQLPRDEAVNTVIGGAQDDLVNAINDITYNGAIKVEGEAAGLLKQFREAQTEGFTSLGVIQNLRSKALEVARDTAAGTNAADRVANKVANAMEEHFRNIVDANTEAGLLSENAADIWATARGLTRNKMETFGAKNLGTKGTEAALTGQALDNTAMLREGLNSPDKMVSQIRAAAAGGEDITPLYKQALKSELDGAPQSKWRDIVDSKRKQWETVFTKEEMATLDANLADVEAELVKNRGSVTSGSATNPRGNVQKVLNSEKGLAGISSGVQNAATLAAAGAGAKYGWDKSETIPGGIANALLYGTLGALSGKGLRSATGAASAKYDEMLINALKNPRAALSAIEAAKPSGFAEALAKGTTNAAIAGASRGTQSILGNLLKNTISPSTKQEEKPVVPTDISEGLKIIERSDDVNLSEKEKPEFTAKVDKIAKDLDMDPQHLFKVIGFETGGTFDPAIKNRAGSGATGLIQFTGETAKNLTGEDTKAAALKILSDMTATEQLDYVKKYLDPFKGKLKSLDDVYMAILYPKAIGKGSSYALFKEGTKAYWQNRGLDINDDGIVTKAEAANKVKMYEI